MTYSWQGSVAADSGPGTRISAFRLPSLESRFQPMYTQLVTHDIYVISIYTGL